MSGLFITIEGGEGLGKSTLAKNLQAALPDLGVKPEDILVTREPGGTQFSEAVRAVMLADHGEYIPPLSEVLLMTAARASHVENVIKPALEQGKVVICDRYIATTVAYQGNGREMDREFVLGLQKNFPVPTLTLLLDADPEVGMERMRGRGGPDRMEQAGTGFFKRVRFEFMEGGADTRLARLTEVITANQPESQVLEQALPHVERVLGIKRHLQHRHDHRRGLRDDSPAPGR